MTPTAVDAATAALDAAQQSTDPVDLSWLDPERGPDSWTLADDTLRFTATLVARLRPTSVVEFGSGVSTRLLATTCAGLDGPTRIVALESDPAFARRTREELGRETVPVPVQLELTHLVVRRWYGRNLPVYDLPASVLDGSPPQLVLVDGPPLPLGGRQGSLLQALHLGAPGTIVLLDDADRASEQAALALTEKILGEAIEVVHLAGFAKGLAAVVVRRELDGSAMPPVPDAGSRGTRPAAVADAGTASGSR